LSVSINSEVNVPYSIVAASEDFRIARNGAGGSTPIAVGVRIAVDTPIAAVEIDGQRVIFNLDPAAAPHPKPWQRYLSNPAASGDVDALSETARSVFETLAKYGPTGVGLVNLDPTRTHGEHLATVLRATFKWRSQVPGWNEALSVAAEALKGAGINPTDALFGLSQ
jgi:hypothetical protein